MTVWIENTTDNLLFENYEETIKEIVKLSLEAENSTVFGNSNDLP